MVRNHPAACSRLTRRAPLSVEKQTIIRAVVFEGAGRLACRRGVPEPTIQTPRDAIVKMERAGICGSDLHQLENRDPLRAGTVFGHELAGVVCDVGSEVAGLREGDRVFSPFSTSCGQCFFCSNGMSARCLHWQVRFPTALTAAVFGQYVEVPEGVEAQDEAGRLWDIVWMLRYGITQSKGDGSEILFELHVRNDNRAAELVQLKAHCGPGDEAEPVITVMLPDED